MNADGPHHVHLLVIENVAVIHVLPSEVHNRVDDRSDWVALRISVVKPSLVAQRPRLISMSTNRHHRIQRSTAIWDVERQHRNDRPHRNDGVLQRTHPHRVFPTKLRWFRGHVDAVPRDAVDHLHIKEVEVNWVRVDTVVSDLPDLRSIGSRTDGSDVETAG